MKKFLTVGVAMVLTACGGGGGGNVAPAAPQPVATAEGIWVGKNSNGVDLSFAVLENGETWGVAAQNGIVFGAIYGTTASSGTTLTGSGKNFDIASRSVSPTTYSGTFVAKSSINVATRMALRSPATTTRPTTNLHHWQRSPAPLQGRVFRAAVRYKAPL